MKHSVIKIPYPTLSDLEEKNKTKTKKSKIKIK